MAPLINLNYCIYISKVIKYRQQKNYFWFFDLGLEKTRMKVDLL